MEGLRPVLVGTRVAASLLDLDEDRVRQLCRSGDLESVRIASSDGVEPRKIRIPLRSLEVYVSRLVAEQSRGAMTDSVAAVEE